MKSFITFNKPFIIGKETEYIRQAVLSGKISGNGDFTKKCHKFFEKKYGFKKCFLTTSCTDALEMCALLLNIKNGDEVIIPSYTFVSTANAFVLHGAKIIFCDSEKNSPNIDVNEIEKLISKKTKAIVVVHYAGIACKMDEIMNMAKKKNIFVIEDAAHSIDSYYKNKPLGSIGHLGCFSFHETKNVISGEGGMLVVNDERFFKRAEIIWEKGTNRSAFWRGEVDKYNWVDVGSSFLPSEIISAFLFAQLQELKKIQKKRISIWKKYYNGLKKLEEQKKILLPQIPSFATNNAHMFYIICKSEIERNKLIDYLKKKNINAVFHYLSLHKSPFYTKKHNGRKLPNADKFTDCLLRLPLYYELKEDEISRVINSIRFFYENRRK